MDDGRHTRTGALIGTPAYMSPELIHNSTVGSAADIYALGVLTFEMLTGSTPFQGPTAAMLHAHAYERPPSLNEHRPDLPPSIVASVAAALEKEPSKRPRSARSFASAFGMETQQQTKPALPTTLYSDSANTRPTGGSATVRQRGGVKRRPLLVTLLGVAVAGATIAALFAANRPDDQLATDQRTAPATVQATVIAGSGQSQQVPATTTGTLRGATTPVVATPRVQDIGISGINEGCCRVTVTSAEHIGGGVIRLMLTFEIFRTHRWSGDARPEFMSTIFLVDERGRRFDLVEVRGDSAADDRVGTTSGWYRFAPLPLGTRTVRLQYGAATITVGLGAATPLE
jgi:hypothetical protein